ncbi:spermidine/putrescine ABC transporter substrate-binding protein [Vibrio brasiliensis]|nr:spermidine/putrescine ABC transporter substrate-binding protein [Vibrio brasiliensis]MCG9727358.1 spermidine/putrescine ABC transporter substrate-binding protein [Vibrio brasiliensis]MCG9751239.1 spermidine/putrescine ABC transporter substrate-binding protein [Vibrio brasiliensis]MCG9784387.1 spermidine/putrescine ABC transporter substrate-binding protein [Vibrio brasiliensis]
MRASLLSLVYLIHSSVFASSLSVYMWEDTLSPKVRDNWEDQSNIPLMLSHFDNDDERSLLMMKSIQLPFDLVVLDNVSAQIYGRIGEFEDLSQLKGRSNNNEIWNQACGAYAVPYFWGTVGITYRKDLIYAPPNTWQEFVAPPPELVGKIGMINDSTETFLPVLYSLGLSPITSSPDELQAAYPKLVEFNDTVHTYEYILSHIRSQSDKESLQMALAYSGDQYSLNRYLGDEKWGYTIPEGEMFLWVDCLAVSSHSDNKEAAIEFLQYLMQPSVAAQNAVDIKAATPNSKATGLLPEWYLNDASLFPPASRLENAVIDSELSAENISLRAKIINRLLRQHEAKH